jgi:hypothetical protein
MLPQVERIRADGAVGRALERIYTLLTALRESRVLKELSFTTASVVANTFPLNVPFSKFRPTGIQVVKVVDVLNPTTIHSSGVWVDWELIDGGFRVKYITGLNVSTLYRLTLEVNGA